MKKPTVWVINLYTGNMMHGVYPLNKCPITVTKLFKLVLIVMAIKRVKNKITEKIGCFKKGLSVSVCFSFFSCCWQWGYFVDSYDNGAGWWESYVICRIILYGDISNRVCGIGH